MSFFDWKEPDYAPIFAKRIEILCKLRADPQLLAAMRVHYQANPADFINDWGVTFDPRNAVEGKLPTLLPFLLFDKQRECVEWMEGKLSTRKPGLIEKSRDFGLSWLTVAYGCTKAIFNDGFIAGYGSRKQEYVDQIDGPKSLFYKARLFMQYLPPEFRAGWTLKKHAPHMRLTFPDTGSALTGEAGDGIGRGDRTSIYIVDEAAYLERAQLIEASLSATTNCRIDVSSVAGMANLFAEKRHAGKIDVFICDWRDDPRKDEAWYALQQENLDAVTIAQEIDRNYNASQEGIVIPGEWVQAAIDAHTKIPYWQEITGARRGSFDVADEGRDKCAYAGAKGVLLDHLAEWSGKGDDIFGSVQRAFTETLDLGGLSFAFDSDGLGAGVRGDARVINEARTIDGLPLIEAVPFRGSGAVVDPDSQIPSAIAQKRDPLERTNKDYFLNAKAQAWWDLRIRFQRTYRAVTTGAVYEVDDLISISSALPLLSKLTSELSQATYDKTTAGKLIIDKTPEGAKSPNLADSVMILYSPQPKRRRGFFTV